MPMASRSGFEALRGAEVQTLDLVFQVSTSEEWAELLKGPLERAAGQGNRRLAQQLVEAGARIGDALHEAVQRGHGEVVADLLDNGASINAKDTKKGATPLHVAAVMDNAQMVQLLMLKGADNNALADDGVSPLCVAACCGHEAAAVALLAGGADVSIAVGERKTLILHLLAQQGSQQRHVDILRAVIEYGADVDAVDTNHRTALHFAAVGDKAKIVNALIEAGANIEARDIQGKTPLHLASVSLRLENLTSLLRHGAHCNAQDNFLLTPLHHVTTKAGMKGAAEVVDVLLRSGADETIVDGEGGTAADVVAAWAEEGVQTEDIEHVRKLLANAPADRAWRRRGYLVLCRAHPDRVQQTPEGDSALTEAIGNSETVGGSGMGGCAGGEWARMVARVLGLREEGIFRTIVGYL